jgi:hypothetical protein
MLQPDPNVKFERLMHSLKQFLEIVSIDEGIEIERSLEHSMNADSPRCASLEPGSNVKVLRFLH